jgi:hypothetical protein
MMTRADKMKWLFVICFGGMSLVLAVVGFIIGKSRTGNLEILNLPSDDEIEKITVSVHDARMSTLENVQDFNVPHAYKGVIMRPLRPAATAYPPHWDDIYTKLGTVVIETRAGARTIVELYDTGKTEAGFKINGVACFRAGKHMPFYESSTEKAYAGEAVLLCDIIRELYAEERTKKKRGRLERYIEQLRRSIGELPPGRP